MQADIDRQQKLHEAQQEQVQTLRMEMCAEQEVSESTGVRYNSWVQYTVGLALVTIMHFLGP